MKIGIIVHSFSGNTYSVAEKMKGVFEEKGHSVEVVRLNVIDENPNSFDVRIEEFPDVQGYDLVIFGGPVRAFSISPALKFYLNSLPDLEGKKAGCFVTQQLPYKWMGANRTIRQISGILKQKNAQVLKTGAASWSEKKKEQSISALLDAFAGIV